MNSPSARMLSKADRVGATVSLACAVHCALLPVVLTVLPLIGLSFFASGVFEFTMISIALCLAVTTLWLGHRVHRNSTIFAFLIVGFVLFALAHLFEGLSGGHGILMALGGVTLALGHLINRSLCVHCRHNCADHEHCRSDS